jgi:hypothetical protein
MKKIPISKVTCFWFERKLHDAKTGQPLPDDHEGLLVDQGTVFETGLDKHSGERYFKVVGEVVGSWYEEKA